MTQPYVTPPTAVAGQPLPASEWNAQVRDSLESVAKPPRVYVYRNTDQLVGNNAVSNVVWTAELYDTDNFWSAGAADRLIIPSGLGGLYLVTFNPIWDINATGGRYSQVMKNGAAVGSPVNQGGSASWYTQACNTVVVPCVPGDYIQGAVYQSSGAGLNLKASVYSMVMTATRIGVA